MTAVDRGRPEMVWATFHIALTIAGEGVWLNLFWPLDKLGISLLPKTYEVLTLSLRHTSVGIWPHTGVPSLETLSWSAGGVGEAACSAGPIYEPLPFESSKNFANEVIVTLGHHLGPAQTTRLTY